MQPAPSQKPQWRERLNEALEKSGRSKRDVSIKAGLGPNYLREILTGGQEPNLKALMAVADELNVTMSSLMQERAA